MIESKLLKVKLEEILSNENIKYNVLMKNHTSFKVGGPADIVVTPKTYRQVQHVIAACNEEKVPYYFVGNGSNVLVKDGGIRGVVIKLSGLNRIDVEDKKIVAQSGSLLSRVSKIAMENELDGMEFASGIPGTIGGAVAMNAGAYGGEMKQIIDNVLVIDDCGNLKRFSNVELELGYRTSIVIQKGYVVLEVVLNLEKGKKELIEAYMKELMLKRKEKQPLEYPSAGSTFKRPEGYYAGKLIEDSGLKGKSIGGAEVSIKHSGFIINKENATAKDILELIEFVQKTVMCKFNVKLETEVKIIGEDA